jgi:hypothetical protein
MVAATPALAGGVAVLMDLTAAEFERLFPSGANHED